MTTLQQRAAPLLALVDASTPGPWRTATGVQDHWQCVIGYLDLTVAACANHGIDRDKANAAAIATLPDLAALLREALAEIERLKSEARCVASQTTDEWAKKALGGIEILSQSRQQVGDVAVSFTVGRIKGDGG